MNDTAGLKNEENNNKSINLSETTRNVFFPQIITTALNFSPSNSFIIDSNTIIKPAGFFLPKVLVTAKGLYPPPLLYKQLPKKSLSVPIKLITMPPPSAPKPEAIIITNDLLVSERENSINTTTTNTSTSPISPLPTPPQPTVLNKSKSSPIPKAASSTAQSSESVLPTPTKSSSISRLKKPTLIEKLLSTINPSASSSSSSSTTTTSSSSKIKKTSMVSGLTATTTIRKAPRPSSSTRTASAAPISIKSSNSIKLVHKKSSKTPSPPPTPMTTSDSEEDIPITKPITLTEKRKRQAKRADQVKIWKVREEREAREQRSMARRNLMSGIISKKSSSVTNVESSAVIRKKKKKRVKFELDKNCIIQLEAVRIENSVNNSLGGSASSFSSDNSGKEGDKSQSTA